MQAQTPAQQPQMQKVRVLRAFYFDGKPQAAGSFLELPKVFALEVIAANKAEAVEDRKQAEIALSTSSEPARGEETRTPRRGRGE